MLLSDFDTLADAQAYEADKERLITSDMMISLLTQHDSVSSLADSTDEKAKGFYLAVSAGGIEFNLMNSHEVGQAQQTLLTYLVSISAVTQAFADACLAYANTTYNPFANATEYTFMRAKGTCPTVTVVPENGWVKITTTTDCTAHNPEVYAEIQGVKQRITRFPEVSAAGSYLAQVPTKYGTLIVDNPYEVIQ